MNALDKLMRDNPALAKALLEQVAAEKSLYAFTELMWQFVEPANPFVGNWHVEAVCEMLEAVTNGDIQRLLINIPPGCMKSLLTDVFWPAWEWIRLPHMRYVCTSYSATLTERDNIRFGLVVKSDIYRSLWGQSFDVTRDSMVKVENNKTGWKIATSVEGMGTGERGNRVICDDLHNVKEGESETVRKETVRYFREVLPSRMTDPKSSAIIVIMQRVHENDVSGTILEGDLGYTHLMLPMKFESDRKCVVFLPSQDEGEAPFFEDPREEEGELLFPERFPDWVVARDEKAMGPYACNPGEAPVLMADMSLKRIDQVKSGDEVLGWIREPGGRAKMVCTRVVSPYKYFGEIVKMTLDSGSVIRCTPDHKWWTGRYEKGRNLYAPVTVGGSLARVCLSSFPILSPEEERLAGWLSGFYDGEGTVTGGKKKKGRAGNQIHIFQGSGRNLPLCEKLEFALKYFGFDYRYTEDHRKPNKEAPCYGYRDYYLLGGQHNLSLAQKFLHIVKPTKWRNRIEEMALGAKFVKQWEKVISIEPDGKEPVYALETETGNYVVWGLASSNTAGQMQQSPTPRGGGIIKRDWWQLWPEGGEEFHSDGSPVAKLEYPNMELIIASVDTAYTEKKENDYCALAILGVFRQQGKRLIYQSGPRDEFKPVYNELSPKIMLMHAWKKRLAFRGDVLDRFPDEMEEDYKIRRKKSWGLLEWVAFDCLRFNVDFLLIENRTAGQTLSQEIKKIYNSEKWATQLVEPHGDKVTRAYSVQHIWAEKMMYTPQRAWSEAAISEMEFFPKGAHDDLTDAIVQGVRWLRDAGWALRRDEMNEVESDRVKHRPKMGPLYDV